MVALLLAAHFAMAWTASPDIGVTADEPVHIVAGLYYWETADYRFQPENGNLPQRLAALPWVIAGVEPPAIEGSAWQRADVWTLGHQMLEAAGPRRNTLLALGRGINALLGVTLVFAVYRWSVALWGKNGGLLSLTLAAFCPNHLAHAGLATSDTAGALFLILATLAAWRLCLRITPARIIAAGMTAGALALAKFSVALLPLVIAVIALFRAAGPADLPWRLPGCGAGRLRGLPVRMAGLVVAFSCAGLVAGACIWAAYGFRYDAAPRGGSFIKDWDTVLITTPHDVGLPQIGEPVENAAVRIKPGPVQHAVGFAREHRLLPEAWLYGLAFVAYHSHSRLAYLNGDYGTTGDWRYFPSAWIWKTPLGGLALLALALIGIAGGNRGGRTIRRLAPLAALALVYAGFSMSGGLNIGLRHLLPLIACSWIVAGAACALPGIATRRFFGISQVLVALLLIAHMGAVCVNRPDHLAFFNRLAGGEAERNRLLVDSNLDWGQGLPALAEWLRHHQKDRATYLSYFGSDDPRFYPELHHVARWGDRYFDRHPRAVPATLGPGLYAFGATQFRRAYTEVRGPWTEERESLYAFLRNAFAAQAQGSPLRSRSGRVLHPDEMLLAAHEYEALTLAKITDGLENAKPLAVLSGGAMLIFELDAAQLERLRQPD